MAEKKNNIALKIKALQLFHQDGLIDIISGAVLLNFGLDILNKSETTSLYTWIPILLLSSLKNKTTIPRLGYDSLGGDKQQIKRWTFFPAAGMVFVMVVLGIFILGDRIDLRNANILPIPGNFQNLIGSFILAAALFAAGLLIPLTALFAAGLLIPLKRFYIYAAVALGAGLINYFFLPIYFPFFFTAGVMLVNGARLMITFTRAYPVNDERKNNEK